MHNTVLSTTDIMLYNGSLELTHLALHLLPLKWRHYTYSLPQPLAATILLSVSVVYFRYLPRDRGAWWAAISGVAQSRTRLK